MQTIETPRATSYAKVYNLGHKAVKDLLNGDVVVEEKVDGSQFSFGVINGELVCRSRKQQIDLDNPPEMFQEAVETAQRLSPHLIEGYIYRAEYLRKPKHNTLVYSRVPEQNLMLFDVMTDFVEEYLSPEEKQAEAERLGLECVPVFYEGQVGSMDELTKYLDRESVLGNVQIEGVVVKNYSQFTPDKKVAIGKVVSEDFRERHDKDRKQRNPSKNHIVGKLIEEFRTEARWEKAIQHLQERGELEGSPRDIGNLIKEINYDVLEEDGEEIKEQLFKSFWKQISKGITAGFPEYYKRKLSEEQFGGGDV